MCGFPTACLASTVCTASVYVLMTCARKESWYCGNAVTVDRDNESLQHEKRLLRIYYHFMLHCTTHAHTQTHTHMDTCTHTHAHAHTSLGLPSYNCTRLCHSCTLCGFCRRSTLLSSSGRRSISSSKRARCISRMTSSEPHNTSRDEEEADH